MYDTLMQMGRWFGYRDSYKDLCRIFLTDKTASWYSYISDSTEELRREIRDMSRAKLTPLEFGLRVRSHPDALIVTARNKMRSGKSIPVKISLAGRLAETSVVFPSKETNKTNYSILESAVEQINKVCDVNKAREGYYWEGVPVDIIIRTIQGFLNHPMSFRTYPEPLSTYLKYLSTSTCDVLLRSIDNAKQQIDFASFTVGLPERQVAEFDDKMIEFNKRRVASRGDECAGIPEQALIDIATNYNGKTIPDKEYRKYRMIHNLPPLFMIQIVEVHNMDKSKTAIVPCYGLSLPGDPGNSRTPGISVEYIVNTVWWYSHFQIETEEEEQYHE
jgi:hypothetical protein